MRILYISDDRLNDDIKRKSLAALAEKASIFFVHDYIEAEDFIINRVEGLQESLDLIICENIFGIAVDFRNTLRRSSNRVYSNRDFNIDKLPVILLIKPAEDRRIYDRQGFSKIIRNFGAEKLERFINEFKDPIQSWRRSVVGELDNMGIKYNSGEVDYGYYFSKRGTYTYTKILSENFQLFPRKLDYYWLNQNQKQIELAVTEFMKMLKKSEQYPKRREEKVYHNFFNRNRFFLERDSYFDTRYELRLPYDQNRYDEPDYTLKPNMNYQTDLSIVEVKLPNEGFISPSKFHPNIYAKLLRHIGQVNDYRDYLEAKENQEYLEQQLGIKPRKIDYNILIGRQQDKEEHLDILQRRFRQMGILHLYLMTYDELLAYQVKFLDRMNLLKIT